MLQREVEIATEGRGLYPLTAELTRIVQESGIESGLAVVFCRHTSASLILQENADPSATADLLAWLERIAPDGDPAYTHTAEGPDDMASHLRSAVTRSSETIPVVRGRPALGVWQGLFLLEHRTAPHRRSVLVHVSGQ